MSLLKSARTLANYVTGMMACTHDLHKGRVRLVMSGSRGKPAHACIRI